MDIKKHDLFLESFSTDLRSPVAKDSGAKFEVQDPATGKTIASVTDADSNLIEKYLEVAHSAQQRWENQSPRVRSNILLKASELLLQKQDLIAATITREMGKPLAESKAEVAFSADYFRWFSEEAVRSDGRYSETPSGGSRLIVTRKAIGVTLLITPWNFPLAMGARKAAAALAAGCTVILKPAELTPLSSLLLADTLYEAGVPEDVFQVATTTNSSGWSQGLMNDQRLKKVSFTGSTRVGSILIEQSAKNIQKLSLELGGDAPFIVFDDADLERAVTGAIISKTRNGGQACVASNRFYVQEGIAKDFLEAFSERLSELKTGSGFEADVNMGPLISQKAKEDVLSLVFDAEEKGAVSHFEVSSSHEEGYFLEPKIITDVPTSAKISKSEIFAPVAMVSEFKTSAEAVAKANDSPYGLAGYVFTQDLDNAFGVAHSLNTGVLGINKGLVADASGPFGGVGYSGYGREGGPEGMQDFQILRQFNLDAPDSLWKI